MKQNMETGRFGEPLNFQTETVELNDDEEEEDYRADPGYFDSREPNPNYGASR